MSNDDTNPTPEAVEAVSERAALLNSLGNQVCQDCANVRYLTLPPHQWSCALAFEELPTPESLVSHEYDYEFRSCQEIRTGPKCDNFKPRKKIEEKERISVL